MVARGTSNSEHRVSNVEVKTECSFLGRWSALRASAAALATALLACCSCGSDSQARAATARRAARRNRQAFEAKTLEGWTFDFTERNARRRIVVYLVDVTGRRAAEATRVAERLHRERHQHNLEVIGVVVPPGYRPVGARHLPAQRPSRAQLAALARGHLSKLGATFPCVLDPDGEIAELYVKAWGRHKLDALPAFYAFPVNAERPTGRAIFAYYGRRSSEPRGSLHRRVLKQFGIEITSSVDPLAGDHPAAPDVTLTDSAGKTHRLSDYRGHVVMVIFIATTCPRCKAALDVLGQMRLAFGRAARGRQPAFEVLAICTDAEGETLRKFVAERGYRFPVASDTAWRLRSAFRYRGATPDMFLIAPDGTIRFRHRAYKSALADVLHMEIAALLGIKTRPMLSASRHAGDRACRICHARQSADWALTRHACAWETLVRVGRETDPECIRCHVVGYREPGGFLSGRSSSHLLDVQCESCHGRNGCLAFHKDPARVPVKKTTCLKCHDAKHSPRFHYPTARPKVLHDQAAQLAKLPRAEREKRLERLCSGAGRQLFDPDTPYVGDAVCGTCHPTELAALKAGWHAKALAPLATAARGHWSVPKHKRGVVGLRKPQCLRCHVTGYGKPGGFPHAAPADPLRHPMAGVGCEMCHGPGKAHADDPKRPRAIARLGGTCNECNVLPICRLCHDDRNSPHFDYKAALPKASHPVGKAKTK